MDCIRSCTGLDNMLCTQNYLMALNTIYAQFMHYSQRVRLCNISYKSQLDVGFLCQIWFFNVIFRFTSFWMLNLVDKYHKNSWWSSNSVNKRTRQTRYFSVNICSQNNAVLHNVLHEEHWRFMKFTVKNKTMFYIAQPIHSNPLNWAHSEYKNQIKWNEIKMWHEM